jgi:iron complex outermembrane receptor protein
MTIRKSRPQLRTPTTGSLVHAAIAAALFGVAPSGYTQNSTDPSSEGLLSEVVVTATRRETVAQDTPISITALGGEALREIGIIDPRQLTGLAPNLIVDQGLSNGNTHVTIRGIASTDFLIGANSPVAVNIDDVYQPYQFGIATQTYDMDRVEVLRGPQGTLFGKNTTSGALNLYSKAPTQKQEGYLQAAGGGGDFGHYSLEGAFNAPLSDAVAMRASMRIDRRDNYVDNSFDGTKIGHGNTYNGRVQFAWTPNDDTDVNLKLFGVRSTGDSAVYFAEYLQDPCARLQNSGFSFPAGYLCPDFVNAMPDAPSAKQRITSSDVPTYEEFDNYGATLKFERRFGGATLTSITNYQEGSNKLAANDDGTAGDAFHSLQASDTKQYSQELRIATSTDARLSAVGGVFFQRDKILANQGSASSQVDVAPFLFGYDYYGGGTGRQEGTASSVFGALTFKATEKLSLGGGLRYSHDKKENELVFLSFNTLSLDFSTLRGIDMQVDDISYYVVTSRYALDPLFDISPAPFVDKKSFGRLTWDATADLKVTDDALLYARIATGFKSGGFVSGLNALDQYNAAKPYVDPEKVDSYELGFKSEWNNRSVRFNGAAFWTDYKDMQVQITNSFGTGSILTNAGKSRIKGAELELEVAPSRSLRINGSFGYTDAKFVDYGAVVDRNRAQADPITGIADASGNQLPYAAKWTASLGIGYEIPVANNRSWSLGTNWTHRSRIFFDPFEEQFASDPGRTMGDARISFGSDDSSWRIAAYVRNLTNENPKAFSYVFGGAGTPNSYLIAPTIYAPMRTWGGIVSFQF